MFQVSVRQWISSIFLRILKMCLTYRYKLTAFWICKQVVLPVLLSPHPSKLYSVSLWTNQRARRWQVLCRRPLLSECILFKDGGGKSDCGLEGRPLALSWGSKPGYSPLTVRDVCVCVFASVALSPLHLHSSTKPEQSPGVFLCTPHHNQPTNQPWRAADIISTLTVKENLSSWKSTNFINLRC